MRKERDALCAELSRAFGIGAKARPSGSASERARIKVQRNVKAAITHVAELDGELGSYLTRAICPGTDCCFRPCRSSSYRPTVSLCTKRARVSVYDRRGPPPTVSGAARQGPQHPAITVKQNEIGMHDLVGWFVEVA
jgi:hypothetical protein